MALTHVSFKLTVDAFNKMGVRPHGNLLTLSRNTILFDGEFYNRICNTAGWEGVTIPAPLYNSINDSLVFDALGFEHIDYIDASGYQGANIIHDLNDTNLPEEMINKYDFILDAGTMEHVFNFGNVLENIFKMLKVGGTFFFDVPTFYGFNHGFYNFSPCVFYEYFLANNYEIHAITPYAVLGNPYAINGGFVYIADPIINDVTSENMLMIPNSLNNIHGCVTKKAETTFDVIPQQGIYANKLWKNN